MRDRERESYIERYMRPKPQKREGERESIFIFFFKKTHKKEKRDTERGKIREKGILYFFLIFSSSRVWNREKKDHHFHLLFFLFGIQCDILTRTGDHFVYLTYPTLKSSNFFIFFGIKRVRPFLVYLSDSFLKLGLGFSSFLMIYSGLLEDSFSNCILLTFHGSSSFDSWVWYSLRFRAALFSSQFTRKYSKGPILYSGSSSSLS